MMKEDERKRSKNCKLFRYKLSEPQQEIFKKVDMVVARGNKLDIIASSYQL